MLTFLPAPYSGWAWTHSPFLMLFPTAPQGQYSLTLLSKCLWEDGLWKHCLAFLWVPTFLGKEEAFILMQLPSFQWDRAVVSLDSWHQLWYSLESSKRPSHLHWNYGARVIYSFLSNEIQYLFCFPNLKSKLLINTWTVKMSAAFFNDMFHQSSLALLVLHHLYYSLNLMCP